MKLKRLTAFVLAIMLVVPAGVWDWLGEESYGLSASALGTPNVTAETGVFALRGSYSGAAYDYLDPEDDAYVASHGKSTVVDCDDQKSGENNSFVYAAAAVLNLAAKENGLQIEQGVSTKFSVPHIAGALSSSNSNTVGFSRKYEEAGNRAMIAAYLARGYLGGPTSDSLYGSNSSPAALANMTSRTHVRGISYIPDLAASATTANREDYIRLLKDSVYKYGAVGISLYLDPDRFRSATLYENFYDYTGTQAPDHTVVLLGWDDTIVLPDYTVVTTNPDGSEKTTPYTPGTGAFWVYDSLYGKYWVSYPTMQKHAKYGYYIDGFIDTDAANFPTLSEDDADPFGLTYEFDPFGHTSSVGFSSGIAYFANVFTASSNAASLQAVSIFLTGEGNSYKIYYVPDYTGTDDLNPDTNSDAIEIASGYEALPGYYTMPVTITNAGGGTPTYADALHIPAKGSKFAIVAQVTCDKGTSPVPIQSYSLYKSGTAGRSYASKSGSSWTDMYTQSQASVCLKAHVENGLTVGATGVALPATKPEDGKLPNGYDSNDYEIDAKGNLKKISGVGADTLVLSVAPGKTYSIGPMYQPLNAGDVIPELTEWWLSDDIAEDPALEWIGYDYNDSDDTSDKTKDPAKMGLKKYRELDSEGNKVIDTPPPLTLNLNKSNQTSGSFSMTASTDKSYFGKEYYLKVSITTGERDENGKFKTTEDGYIEVDSYVSTIIVRISAIATESIELSKTEHTMKADGTVSLKATISPSDASVVSPDWKVVKEATYNKDTKKYTFEEFERAYDPADPYNDKGPVVTISDTGKVTAIKDGTCYVYAEIVQGTEVIQSVPCKITVTEVAATGISLNKKKYTMSTGTKLTLKATVKPTSASNKKVSWKVVSGGEGVISIDEKIGIITALAPGTASVIAETNKGGYTAECVITVSNAPTGVYKIGKSVTLAMLGSGGKDTVKWEIEPADGGGGYDLPNPDNGLTNDFFTASQSGHKLKISASKEGRVRVTAAVYAESYDEEGTLVEGVKISEQSWTLEAVVPLSKLQLMNVPEDPSEQAEIVKKVTLCIDPSNSSRNESIDLQAVVVKPISGATLLDFEWDSKKPEVADVEIMSGVGSHNSHVTIAALSEGSTKITGTNYNSKKKVSITIKVLKFPETITTKRVGTLSEPFVLAVGKNRSLTSRITDKKVNKEVKYTLYNQDGSEIAADDKTAIATVTTKGKVTAQREGIVTLVAKGAPYDDTAPMTEIVISCAYPVKKVLISGPRSAVAGTPVTIKAGVDPFNATNPALVLTGAELTDNGDGTYTFTPTAAGRVKIIAESVENPKKKRNLNIKITEPKTTTDAPTP